MKFYVSLIAVACLVASSSEAQVLFSQGFTGQTPGATVSGFTAVTPSTATTVLGAIVTNVAGNNAMNIYDNNASSAARVDQDFTHTNAVHLSLSFTRNANIAPATTTAGLYVILSTNAAANNTQANRDLAVRLFNDGTYRIDRGLQDYSTGLPTNSSAAPVAPFDSGSLTIATHTLDIYAYAGPVLGATLGYTGPDAVARVLDPNSFMVYIDGIMAPASPSGSANGNYGFFNSALYGTDLGRFTFLSSASAIVGVDFLIDNISLTTIAAVPEPSTFALLGTGGLLLIGALRRSRRSR